MDTDQSLIRVHPRSSVAIFGGSQNRELTQIQSSRMVESASPGSDFSGLVIPSVHAFTRPVEGGSISKKAFIYRLTGLWSTWQRSVT